MNEKFGTGYVFGGNYKERAIILEIKGVPYGEPWYQTEDGDKHSAFDVTYRSDEEITERLKSEEARKAMNPQPENKAADGVKLPTYEEAMKREGKYIATPIDEFIIEHQPAGKVGERWRLDLGKLIQFCCASSEPKEHFWTEEPPNEQGPFFFWNGDVNAAPYLLHVMWSAFGNYYFVCIKDDPLTRPVNDSAWDGWWLKVTEPQLPELV